MRTSVTVSTGRRGDGTPMVTVTGELDMTNIDGFSKAVADAVSATDGSPVEVDLSGVEYLDSAAINALFAYPGRVRVLANPILLPVLTVSGLTKVMSVEAASR